MALKHSVTATGTNDTGKQVSKDAWNEAHVVDADGVDFLAGATPAAPAADNIRAYGKNRAGRMLLNVLDPDGDSFALQPSLFGGAQVVWFPGTGTTVGINFGCSFTARNSGTSAAQAHPTQATTNAMTSMRRATFGTGTTTTGASGIQTSAATVCRGNAAGIGGFFMAARFGIETLASDIRAFVGLSANNAAIAANPSTWNNTFGVGKDATDTNWQIIARDGSAVTKTDTGCAVTAGQILDLYLYCKPNDTKITARLVDAVTGTVYVGNVQFTANLPVNTTFLYMQAHIQAQSGTTAKLLALNKMYQESRL